MSKIKIPLQLNLPPLYDKQKELVDAFDSRPGTRYVVGACGSKTGKTWGAAHRMVRQAWANKNSLNWWIAPVYYQSDMAARLIMDFLPRSCFSVTKKPTTITLIDPNGHAHSQIVFKSAEIEKNLRGFAVNFIVADEMSSIDEDSYSAFMTTITQTKGKVLYISTPKGHNLFYDLYQRGNKSRLAHGEIDPYPEYFSMSLSTYANPYVDKESIDSKKKELTETMFRQEILGVFLEDASQVFGNYKQCVSGTLEEPKNGVTYIAGIDLAKTHDYSVIVIFNTLTNHLVYFDRFNQLSWTTQRERIRRALHKYNNALAVVDANSIGDPNVEELVKMGLIIYPFYVNSNQVKRELVEKLAVAIEQRTISYPPIPELMRELEDYELIVNPSGVVRYSAPSGKFDDVVSALYLCNFFLSNSKDRVYKASTIRGI